jgi:hypothetical protein
MFVRDQHRIQRLRRFANPGQPGYDFAAADAGIDEQARVGRGDKSGVAGAAAR